MLNNKHVICKNPNRHQLEMSYLGYSNASVTMFFIINITNKYLLRTHFTFHKQYLKCLLHVVYYCCMLVEFKCLNGHSSSNCIIFINCVYNNMFPLSKYNTISQCKVCTITVAHLSLYIMEWMKFKRESNSEC